MRFEGTIKSIVQTRGFGFLSTDTGEQFFHFKALSPDLAFDDTLIGRVVTFTEEMDSRSGRLRAMNIRPL